MCRVSCPRLWPPFARLLCCLGVLLLILSGCGGEAGSERGTRLLIDEAGALGDIAESTERSLQLIRDEYRIEVVLATLDSSSDNETLRETAARLFTEWDVGRDYDGQGLLLLLAERDKEVRIEVGSALEHVFTDLLTGYIETKQLKSYYLSGQLEIGLLAVLEEIEARAQLMSRNQDDAAAISSRDQKFLSGGGGADVALTEFQKETVTETSRAYSAGATPDEAWQTLLTSWRDRNRNPDIGVYTPVTRLIYRDFTSQPERRFEEDVRTWGSKPYEILADGNYAVIFFGNKKGWENAPFLFCRTEDGWQFDMVHQRKLVRMGRAPAWGIERGEHPYILLMSRCPYWMGQDIPRSDDDIYSVSEDRQTAALILQLENQLEQDAEDFSTLYELGRLYTLTSMGQRRLTMLNKARKLRPDHPGVLKQLAIAHVDAHYQYETALALMISYAELRPEDPFGHFFLGYLQLMTDQPDNSISALTRGLTLDPENVYGLAKLARAHLARDREDDRQRATEIFEQLKTIAPDHLRTGWLEKELQ